MSWKTENVGTKGAGGLNLTQREWTIGQVLRGLGDDAVVCREPTQTARAVVALVDAVEEEAKR